jgi:hypothetical protein
MIHKSNPMQIVTYNGYGDLRYLYLSGTKIEIYDALSPRLIYEPAEAEKVRAQAFQENPLLPKSCITVVNIEIVPKDCRPR